MSTFLKGDRAKIRAKANYYIITFASHNTEQIHTVTSTKCRKMIAVKTQLVLLLSLMCSSKNVSDCVFLSPFPSVVLQNQSKISFSTV